MKLLVKNLGPIRGNTQTIDLSKRFYIFVGPNNSGKTYVSQLLWTIFNEDVIRKFARSNNWEEITWQGEEFVNLTEELIGNIVKGYAQFLEEEIVSTLNADLLPRDQIYIAFDYDLDELKNDKFQANFHVGSSETSEEYRYMVITKKPDSLSFHVRQETLPDDFFNTVPKSIFEQELQEEIKSSVVRAVIQLLLKHKHNTFFLPASRVFYPILYQYIYEIERKNRAEDIERILDLIDKKPNEINLDSVKNLKRSQRRYTKPMNDALEKTYSLNLDPTIVPYYKNFLEQLAKIMGGDIVLKRLEGISPVEFFFNFGEEGRDLPMYLASSSVNQLSLLYLYFKYWVAERNNFLMMDEPEENLHPENQIYLLELLIQFATQNDNKVLITTHSPLMANAINNYIYLDILKNELKCDVDRIVEDHNLKLVSTDASVSKDDVGVYFFNGKRIINYGTDYYGAYFRDFREITNAQEESIRKLIDYIYLQEDEDE